MVSHHTLENGWQCHIYHEWRLPQYVVDDWNRIAIAYDDKSVFIDYSWFDCWWSAFGALKTPAVVVLRKDGAAKAFFPFYVTGNELTAITNSHTCHYDFIVDPHYRAEAINGFCELLAKISPAKTTIEHMATNSENFALLAGRLGSSGWPSHVETYQRSPFIEIADSWETYFRSLPRGLRDTIKNCRNKTRKLGTLSLETIESEHDLDRHLDVIFEVEGKGWKGRSGSAIKSRPEIERFYRSFARKSIRSGRLLLRQLLLDGNCIAADYCIKSGGTVFLLKTGYDEAHSLLSPGVLLRSECFQELFKRPDVSKYNFLGACDPWKMRWAKDTETYGRVSIYPRSLRGRTHRFMDHGWKETLKRSATVRRAKIWLDEHSRRNAEAPPESAGAISASARPYTKPIDRATGSSATEDRPPS